MAPREPTNQQISSRLSYSQDTPSFLRKFQNRMAGLDEEEDYDDDEYEGRPRRPTIPERPDDNPGSADEDSGDEKPQVVVLRAGKHLTAREATNVQRKERGLQPLPEPVLSNDDSDAVVSEPAPVKAKSTNNLSFSSSKTPSTKVSKRKAIGQPDVGESTKKTKKHKKVTKKLLSFSDDT